MTQNSFLKVVIISFIAIILLVILITSSIFFVEESEKAIVLQFGEAKCSVTKPGIHYKIPFLQSVKKYNVKYRVVPIEAKELTCADSKRIVINAFAYFYVSDIINFYTSVGSYNTANVRVANATESCMREVVGRYKLASLLSEERSMIMKEICDRLNIVISKYGVSVIDFRISKADLPDENRGAVYKRMQTQREQEARKIRAEGSAEATSILAEADREKKVIIANAYKQSQGIKAEGEKKSAAVYNKYYSSDIEFFKFFRSIESYKKVFTGKDDTTFMLDTSSKFFKYLNLQKDIQSKKN